MDEETSLALSNCLSILGKLSKNNTVLMLRYLEVMKSAVLMQSSKDALKAQLLH